MKKVTILLIVLACISCKSEKQKPPFPDFPPEDTVKVAFDFDAFNKHRKLWMEKYGDDNLPSGTYYINADNRYVTQDSFPTGYLLQVFRGVYGDVYTFSLSGMLVRRGFFFTNDGQNSLFDVKNAYFFDEQGKLDSVGNYDINYKFNTDSVIAFLQARGLKVWDNGVIWINRGEEQVLVEKGGDRYSEEKGHYYGLDQIKGTGKYRWDLQYILPETKEMRQVYLDAETGAILKDSVMYIIDE